MNRNDYLQHYGVKGMKWGVRKAVKLAANSHLGRAVRTDYEMNKAQERARSEYWNNRSANKQTLKRAKQDYRSLKKTDKAAAKSEYKTAKSEYKTAKKANRKEFNAKYNEYERVKRDSYNSLNAGERFVYGVAKNSISKAAARLDSTRYGQIAKDTVKSTIDRHGDTLLSAFDDYIRD